MTHTFIHLERRKLSITDLLLILFYPNKPMAIKSSLFPKNAMHYETSPIQYNAKHMVSLSGTQTSCYCYIIIVNCLGLLRQILYSCLREEIIVPNMSYE